MENPFLPASTLAVILSEGRSPQSKDLLPPEAPPMAEGTPVFLARLAAAGRKILRLRYTPLRMTERVEAGERDFLYTL